MIHHMELLAILICAVCIVFLFRKLNLPAILAYLVAGTLVGEHGLALAYDNADYDHVAPLKSAVASNAASSKPAKKKTLAKKATAKKAVAKKKK